MQYIYILQQNIPPLVQHWYKQLSLFLKNNTMGKDSSLSHDADPLNFSIHLASSSSSSWWSHPPYQEQLPLWMFRGSNLNQLGVVVQFPQTQVCQPHTKPASDLELARYRIVPCTRHFTHIKGKLQSSQVNLQVKYCYKGGPRFLIQSEANCLINLENWLHLQFVLKRL